jgi:hypothetical protein
VCEITRYIVRQPANSFFYDFLSSRLRVFHNMMKKIETSVTYIMRNSIVPQSVHFGVRSRKLNNVGQSLDGWPKIYYLELLRALEGTLSRWSQHLQSLALTNLHWARVEGYGPFSLCVIHKESLCPSSGDINRLISVVLTRGSARPTAARRCPAWRRSGCAAEARPSPPRSTAPRTPPCLPTPHNTIMSHTHSSLIRPH